VSVPICPMMTTTWDGTETSTYGRIRCQGSACVLFVPEVASDGETGARMTGSDDAIFRRLQREGGDPTGRGWCAHNLRREPYPDPAKETP